MIWVAAINDQWYRDKHQEDMLLWYSLCYIMRGIEGVVNSIVLFTHFEMNRKVYMILCRSFDKCCYQCYVKGITKGLSIVN